MAPPTPALFHLSRRSPEVFSIPQHRSRRYHVQDLRKLAAQYPGQKRRASSEINNYRNPYNIHSLTEDSGCNRKAYGPLEVISGYLPSRRGFNRKASGPLEVISGYSHSVQKAPLSFHHLSLHTQAHEECFKQHFVTAFAGRPEAMRESRTLSSLKDSGLKLAQNPPNLSRTEARKHESCKEVMSSVEYNQNIPTHRKCSELAKLTRKVHRINKRRYQRQLFRKIRSQALCLASQLPAYIAQEPTNPANGNLSPSTVDLHTRSVAHTHSEDLSCSNELSDYQDAVLLNKYPTSLRIATLTCRGLSSLSKRERVIHLMHKNKIDVLCLQETKINSNSREEHDGFIMFWSSGIEDDCRNKAEELKRSGKGSRNNAAHARIFALPLNI